MMNSMFVTLVCMILSALLQSAAAVEPVVTSSEYDMYFKTGTDGTKNYLYVTLFDVDGRRCGDFKVSEHRFMIRANTMYHYGAKGLDSDEIKCYYPFGIVASVMFHVWKCKQGTGWGKCTRLDDGLNVVEYELTDVTRGYTYNLPCSVSIRDRHPVHCPAHECRNHPCQNAGTCEYASSTEDRCECLRQYVGINCEFDNPCDPDPCNGHGTCTVSSDYQSRTCHCNDMWLGIDCQYRKYITQVGSAVFS